MKAMVATSINTCGSLAGMELTKDALKGLRNPKLAFLFMSSNYNYTEVYSGIKKVNSDINVIGSYVNGPIITPDGVTSSSDGCLGMMILDENEMSVAVAAAELDTDPREYGVNLAKQALKRSDKKYNPSAIAIFSNTNSVDDVIRGIKDVVGEIQIFGGGLAKDNKLDVIGDDRVISNGCVVAFIYTNKNINNITYHNYKESDDMGIVSRVFNHHSILEIDRGPALKSLVKWMNITNEVTSDDFSKLTLVNPIGFKLVDNSVIIRHPVNPKANLSFAVGADIPDKCTIIKMEYQKKSSINLDNCGNKIFLIIDDIDKMINLESPDDVFMKVKKVVNNAPFLLVGFDTEIGEINHTGTNIQELSTSLTFFEK